jgi:GNAT superfamily N-acetyltransferase
MLDVHVHCPIFDSARVQQVARTFDLQLAPRTSEHFQVDIRQLHHDWQIGLIVGPSGSGKTTVARTIFPHHFYQQQPWPRDRAVIDGLGEHPIDKITRLFTTVGFSSPPAWLKPYHILSSGEQFRCNLARALSSAQETHQQSLPSPIVAFDDFTSVVDRTVAQVTSATIAKGIHSGHIKCRFVAVTCHYDVTDWLQPDWIIDMAASTFQRRSLRRPPIELKLFRCRRSAWQLFARHHYLSHSISTFARCFITLWNGTPVAFCATLPLIGRKNRRRISRIVTLPDYQGIGIGMTTIEAVADLLRTEGNRVNVTASHPALIAHCRSSPNWQQVNAKRRGSPTPTKFSTAYRSSAGRAVVSFEYIRCCARKIGKTLRV